MQEYRTGFVLEQTPAQISHGRNLQANIPTDASIRPYWIAIPWETSSLAAHIPVYRSNWTVRAGWRARRGLAALARQVHLDLLFFQTQTPALLAVDWLHRVPGVVSVGAVPGRAMSDPELDPLEAEPGSLGGWQRRLTASVFRAARCLVAWSEWTRLSLINDYDVQPDKVVVIPPGVDVRRWSDPALPVVRPTPVGMPVKILCAGGQLGSQERLGLLDAFRALRGWEWASDNLAEWGNGRTHVSQNRRVELHLVTQEPIRPEPGVFVHKDIGPDSRALSQLYFDCHVFCLPMYNDRQTMALAEAAAAGLPAVSTRRGAVDEVVRDGETGFLVEPGDVPGLTQALRRLVIDPDLRLRLGARAAAFAAERFDATKNTARLLELLGTVARAAAPISAC